MGGEAHHHLCHCLPFHSPATVTILTSSVLGPGVGTGKDIIQSSDNGCSWRKDISRMMSDTHHACLLTIMPMPVEGRRKGGILYFSMPGFSVGRMENAMMMPVRVPGNVPCLLCNDTILLFVYLCMFSIFGMTMCLFL